MRKTITKRDWTQGLVGPDRDAAALADKLHGGTSLVIAGPRGSGRSFLIRAIVTALEQVGSAPVVLRPSAALSAVAFGAVEAAGGPPRTDLRDDDVDWGGAIVVIDDVDLLDAASAAAITRAVAARRLTALIGLRTARARGVDRPDDADGVRRNVLDLWFEGQAERIDLTEVTASEANDIISQFPGADLLDSATRAGLVWRADGSRSLLRHLVLEAVGAAAAGRDPLRALQNVSPQSRLAVALERHLDDIGGAGLECLAVVHRLPHLEMAVATRLFPREDVAALVATGLLHADATATRRLTANDLVARAAQERVGFARIDAFVTAAGARMLAEADEWWSVPISLVLAEKWHRHGLAAVSDTPIDPAVLARLARDAAQDANDRGDADHAAAHAARGLRVVDDAALRLEAQVAAEMHQSVEHTSAGLPDTRARRRLARIHARRHAPDDDAGAARATADADAAVERLLLDADAAGADLAWDEAADAATRATMVPVASTVARLRALVAAGTARAFRGQWAVAQEHYGEAEQLLEARHRPADLPTRDRLGAVMFMLAGYHVAGADGSSMYERLERELETAAREGDDVELTIAGAAAAIAFASQGRPTESQRELTAALAREPLAVSHPDAAMIELGVAEELAMSGRPSEARASLQRVPTRESPLLQHGLRYVETTILASEGRFDDARRAARETAEWTRAGSAPALRIRDLFRLSTLGVASADEVDELVQLAATTDLPLAAEAVRRVSAHFDEQHDSPVDELRLHTLWNLDPAPSRGDAGTVERLPAHSPDVVSGEELTRREHEIAELVTEGLTNREIAVRLFLSVRTVESHVYQARMKVGASSRRELGRMVAAGVVPTPAARVAGGSGASGR